MQKNYEIGGFPAVLNYSATLLQLHSTLYYLLLCESSFFVLFPFLPCFAAVELMGSETFLDYSRLHVGSVLPRDILVPRVKNFVGYVSQLKFNGVDYFDRYYLVLSCFMIFITSKVCPIRIPYYLEASVDFFVNESLKIR